MNWFKKDWVDRNMLAASLLPVPSLWKTYKDIFDIAFLVFWFLIRMMWPILLILFLLVIFRWSFGKFIFHGRYKKCPVCAEHVKRKALKCKYCGNNFNPR